MRISRLIQILTLSSFPFGCGALTPAIDYAYDNELSHGTFVNAVARHVN